MALWTSEEAERATGGRATRPWAAEGVSIDTRSLRPGDLFVALRASRDGHGFVAEALRKGAAAAIVDRVPEGVAGNAPLLVVADVQAALEALGRAGRDRARARVVGVTGSAGKTSTKEMLRAALSACGRTHAAEASYNNHWGVPLTLARLPREARFAVVEIGMNHPGEIAPLSRLARPHVVIVTTIGAAHLEAFADGLDGIAREKGSICEGLEPGGVAVLNGDVPQAPILVAAARRAGARVVLFGESEGLHHRLLEATVGRGATVARARAWRTPLLLKVGTEGRHFALNALAALAAARALGADRALALNGLAAGRGGAHPAGAPRRHPGGHAGAGPGRAGAARGGGGRPGGGGRGRGPLRGPAHALAARGPARGAAGRVGGEARGDRPAPRAAAGRGRRGARQGVQGQPRRPVR